MEIKKPSTTSTRAECVNFNGGNKIRFHFTEWSYPSVWGEPATCILPDELGQLVEKD